MRELELCECIQIEGGTLTAALVTGAVVTFVGWVCIIYNKDVMYQLYKIDNVALVSGMGAIAGGLSYLAGALI